MAGTVVANLGFGTNTPVLVRAGRCLVTTTSFINEDSATRYLQVFDAATVASVTVGTTAPYLVLAAATLLRDEFFGDICFTNGIVVVGTTTATGNTGIAAGKGSAFFVVE